MAKAESGKVAAATSKPAAAGVCRLLPSAFIVALARLAQHPADELPLASRIWAPAACFRLVNWLV
jgi:hypothetical protein